MNIRGRCAAAAAVLAVASLFPVGVTARPADSVADGRGTVTPERTVSDPGAPGPAKPGTTASGRVNTRPARPAPRVAASGPAKPGRTVLSRDGAPISVRRETTAGRPAPKLAPAATVSPMDLDRDGKDDPVVSGFLTEGYGIVVSYSGLPHVDHISAPHPSPTAPNFGEAMTSGDFNGDGYADLAVSNPGEFTPSGQPFGGGVWVFYSSATGLDTVQPQHFTQGVGGVPGVMEEYDHFGMALAAGDLNGDGRADLAIGAYGEMVNGQDWAGSVTVLYGGAGGLTTTGVQLITQATTGVPSDPEPSDMFGWALAIGDMTGDGFGDLAISAVSEGEWSQPFEGGIVMLLRGGSAGVTATGVTSFLGASLGLGAVGDSLAIADVDGDTDGDLVVGVPRSWIGYVVYVPGSAGGLEVARTRVISLDTPGVPGASQGVPTDSIQTFFGFSVATGDATGDGRADVLTGSIGYDVGGAVDAGAVFLIPGTASGLTGEGTVTLTQAAPAWAGLRKTRQPAFEVPELNDYFGYANAILNLDGTGPLDLVTATSHEDDSGLIAWLDIAYTTPRRTSPGQPPAAPVAIGLAPLKVGTGDGFDAYNIGYTLLHR